jgi:hypothetical protein
MGSETPPPESVTEDIEHDLVRQPPSALDIESLEPPSTSGRQASGDVSKTPC